MHKPFVIMNAKIYLQNSVIERGYLYIDNGKITEIGTVVHDDWKVQDIDIIDLKGKGTVIPGLIDIHVHGANDSDAMDGTEQSIGNIAKTLAKEGTTSFLATTMTQSTENIEVALQAIARYENNQQKGLANNGAELLGIHLEGPFISKKRAGAQPVEHMISPNLELFKKWETLANDLIKIVTFAPEEKDGFSFASYLHDSNIIASIGHSDAIYQQVEDLVKLGDCHATHLFNGMRGLHHREPGVAGSSLLFSEVTVEIIADGIHISPPMVKLAFEMKGKNGIILITDAMRAKALQSGADEYSLAGQRVIVDDTKAVLEDGRLAGSMLKMNHALKNMISYTDCSLADALIMAAENPAKRLNVFDRKGSIAQNKEADLVVINDEFEVVMTFCRGNQVL